MTPNSGVLSLRRKAVSLKSLGPLCPETFPPPKLHANCSPFASGMVHNAAEDPRSRSALHRIPRSGQAIEAALPFGTVLAAIGSRKD